MAVGLRGGLAQQPAGPERGERQSGGLGDEGASGDHRAVLLSSSGDCSSSRRRSSAARDRQQVGDAAERALAASPPRTRAGGGRSGTARRPRAGRPSCPARPASVSRSTVPAAGPERQVHAEHRGARREIEQQLARREAHLPRQRVLHPLEQVGVLADPGLRLGGHVAGGEVERALVQPPGADGARPARCRRG